MNATTNDEARTTDGTIPYRSLLEKYEDKARSLREKLQWLSFIRLSAFVLFIFLGYRSLANGGAINIIGCFLFLAAFLLLIRYYDRMQQLTSFYKALAKLNRDEIDFLVNNSSSYPNGQEFIDPHHPYSYDLDLFGDGGLYPYLNRCSTPFGKDALAKLLLHPDKEAIVARQEAIGELKDRLEFRQHLQAKGSLLDTKEKEMRQLKSWLESKAEFGNRMLYYILCLFPLVSLVSLLYYFFTENDSALNLFYFLFVLNIIIAMSFARRIYAHLSVSTSVTKILNQYAEQLKQVETQSFLSPLMQKIQSQLKAGKIPASQSIARLATLFNYLETIINLVVSIALNGLFLFHLHILFALEQWKDRHAKEIIPWLETLGEVESLNSLANHAFNNKEFCTPQLSATETWVADNLGHPLIRPKKRINNDISFAQQRFVILTGSNMSGKSTFLRTLGINLVLARAGGVVCASRFIFYPYFVQVSMRISDSLQDSESFFYAELKRLHAIIQRLESGEKIFVVLDEILRGTNSNDKHSGTIGLIKKLVAANATGIIATHDLTVSHLTEENTGYLSNKCFESEIINDELVFDYKLKDGVCSRLSASFLMKKMNII